MRWSEGKVRGVMVGGREGSGTIGTIGTSEGHGAKR